MSTEETESFEYALDGEGNKILPNLGLRATCPYCGTEVYAACGEKNRYHWRHNNTSDSHCDEWYEMTLWHLKWQELFPLECREVVMKKGDKTHRADVKVGNLIIEFQHSSLDNPEVKERELFYGSDSTKIIWIIDGTANRLLGTWRKHLTPEKLKPVFLVDKESNIYFQTEGYVGIPLIRNVDKEDGLPIGLVINPEYPNFIDLGDYIACPLEKFLDPNRKQFGTTTGTIYSKNWGRRKNPSTKKYYGEDVCGFHAQDFILVKKNDFIKVVYNIPTELDYFEKITICDEEVLNNREFSKRDKERLFLTKKKEDKYANYTIDELEKRYQEDINTFKNEKKIKDNLTRIIYFR
ncbi:hypothetical protein H6G54_28445 [Anabaena cylindrica FACHB-243]|uniref:Competence protein CoiA nuclease-like domain-containing protein n=1 Tax=Anabaena cylindrica (strain ATCC 27899 / PCC 7122) TaxID=272123 RepID=K9ZSD5_ANACC|nr:MULTISPECIES: hypothetical protein [Anabaena]AFZ61447.1 hypothetical protein Anacy_6178 [Anabaena cylindrica PCC 7122]MBD2421538.1 hypothetical protein [Anabaena cylindrica FACHB-243]MBY5284237.1 hypothetical protein [Anabaena sp. CCAP 1446/1C]MBY5310608.1 hypothetical protein [Anabaena sp. CCAP 1446/1C]MCM2405954.1 hypothetical protein [Anabaena sp. CCAP 1446/1C]